MLRVPGLFLGFSFQSMFSGRLIFIPRLHDTAGCQTGLTTGLTTGCIL